MDRQITPQSKPQQAIEALLSHRIGLDPKVLGTTTLTQAVAQMMAALGFTDPEAYLQHLNRSEVAVEALVEAVVVPETSFFRNVEAFMYLRRHILSTSPPRPWRLLSLPCSTGEEPYSMAINLLDAGVPPEAFQIDGVDVSPKALAKAKQGVYEQYSFRQTPNYSPERHLQQYFCQISPGQYQIDARVRSQVQFYQGNLTQALALKHAAYDVIFCRNVLIYFHDAACDYALGQLYRLLVPDGLLFVGYAETRHIDLNQLTPVKYPQAFAYRKSGQSSTPAAYSTVAQPLQVASRPLQSELTPDMPSNQSATHLAQSPSRPKPTVNDADHRHSDGSWGGQDITSQPQSETIIDVSAIRELADSGSLAAAREHCHHYLNAHPTNAEAYLLLGEIYQAQGVDSQAQTAFQKALYLNPNCEAALLHLALLHEQRGEFALAQRLRLRIKRLL